MEQSELDKIVEQLYADEDLKYIFIAGKNGFTTNKAYAIGTNSTYNLVFSLIQSYPHLIPQIQEAINDFKSNNGTPHERPE